VTDKTLSLIPIAKPWMDEREAKAAERPILAGWVTQGPEVEAFEREFADSVGALNACAVSNCTSALHLALRAVGVRPGDEVVTVSHSFIATANSIRYCGADPVFVDIEPGTFNMDPRLLANAISRRTKAILCVHQMGMPCDLRSILAEARRHSLPVIEDAACAIGSEILWNDQWEKIGKPHADIACFSLHPRKVITTGDGGMITTAHAEWDRLFRLWRQHSMSVPDAKRHSSATVIFESYLELGFNYRMTDVQAAIGREQLKRLPEIIFRRRLLADRYRKLLRGIPDLKLPVEPDWSKSNWQSYCVRLPSDRDQRKVMQFMLDRGIATRRGIMCAHREAVYSDYVARQDCKSLAGSESAQDRCLLLPLYSQLEESDQDRVIQALSDACQSSL
jgi:dTDP-4-amino-4,6-dideoxygalactose transaminase